MQARGVTLIEMLIVVLLIGILGAIAYPAYQQHVLRSYRAEAVKTLLILANRQEQRLADYGAYTADLAQLGFAQSLSESGRYRITVELTAGQFAYQLRVTAEGPQTQDRDCLRFSLNHLGQRNHTLTEPLSCWN
ncbi:prepilin-type N-terminal cleavage/methylation domain-containing protein [Rheinheimera sp. UJ51]|uniref:type IV pilin protein n=1 Tax=Rheinheimera sp. UJ51 TaxID=2892446 RepID=UPI001E59CB5C|nr:type IV pilin protein [Rheinheimera sp. UJ51]MCC5452655.1 prepilin-type N-terminal cleavage/methylation domain-containing protein [Rheinheimera sp. UJ51]